MASLKTEVDKLDKLALVSVHLNKFRDVVENGVFKKAVYGILAAKVNNTDTSDFINSL